jgi:hypothetical protein
VFGNGEARGRVRNAGELGAVVASVFYLFGCGGDSGGAGACGISGCGGDIKGTWDIEALCIRVSSKAFSTGIAACDAAAQAAVASAKVTSMAQITFTDTTYTMTGTVGLDAHYVFTNACLTAGGGSSASAATCNSLQTNLTNTGQVGTCSLSGETCVCDSTQSIPLSDSGSYSVDGTNLVMGSERDPFCVQGDTAQISAAGAGIDGSMSLARH